MRATISFDINADKVEATMGALIGQQSTPLRNAANILDGIGNSTLLEEVSEAIDLMSEATSQLQQYKDMLVGFERARLEGRLGDNSPAVPLDSELPSPTDLSRTMEHWDSFIDKINEANIRNEDDNAEEG